MCSIVYIALLLLVRVVLRECRILIAVGKDATDDGSVLLAHTDDAGRTASDVRMVRVPAQDHLEGAKRADYATDDGFLRVVTHEGGPNYAPKEGEAVIALPNRGVMWSLSIRCFAAPSAPPGTPYPRAHVNHVGWQKNMFPKAHALADSRLVRGVRGVASSFKHSPRRSARRGRVRHLPPPSHTLHRTGMPHPPPCENKGPSTYKTTETSCYSDKPIFQTRPKKRQVVALPRCTFHV